MQLHYSKIKKAEDDYPSIIECTVISNNKNIAAGEELVLHRTKVVKVIENSVMVSLESASADPAAKKRRTSR